MILTTTRFGLMACRHLVGSYYENRFITATEIAHRCNINVRALVPSLRRLVIAGILLSRTGGTTPGYIYTKSPEEITLYQLLVILEGENKFYCCKDLVPGFQCDCSCTDKRQCPIFSLFNEILESASERLSTTTIAQCARSAGNNPIMC